MIEKQKTILGSKGGSLRSKKMETTELFNFKPMDQLQTAYVVTIGEFTSIIISEFLHYLFDIILTNL